MGVDLGREAAHFMAQVVCDIVDEVAQVACDVVDLGVHLEQAVENFLAHVSVHDG